MTAYFTQIPVDEQTYKVQLAYLEAYLGPNTPTSLLYLNRIRLFRELTLTSHLARRFHEDTNEHLRRFDELLESNPAPAILVGAPSDEPFTLQLLDVARARFPDALDLSTAFSKEPGVSIGRARNQDEASDLLVFAAPELPDVPAGGILIIDDVVAEGRTAAAILRKLEQILSLEGRLLTVACALAGTKHGPLPADG